MAEALSRDRPSKQIADISPGVRTSIYYAAWLTTRDRVLASTVSVTCASQDGVVTQWSASMARHRGRTAEGRAGSERHHWQLLESPAYLPERSVQPQAAQERVSGAAHRSVTGRRSWGRNDRPSATVPVRTSRFASPLEAVSPAGSQAGHRQAACCRFGVERHFRHNRVRRRRRAVVTPLRRSSASSRVSRTGSLA